MEESMTGHDSPGDPAVAALNDVADAAEETAREQHQVAVTSRRLSRERAQGASWREITDGGRPRTLLGLLGASARRLSAVGKGFRRALAVALAREGLTTRQIGERFGVSHQRVSSLLRQKNDGGRTSSQVDAASDSPGDGEAEMGRAAGGP
jgi:Homeodomain-like domain